MTVRDDEPQEFITDWLATRLPGRWLAAPAEVEVDDDEILVLLPLVGGTDPGQFRQTTRAERIRLAQQAEEAFGRRVSWGVVAAGTRRMFTTVAAPVTTALAMPERRVLDSLVSAGVARDRSQAVSWCVRLVGRHEADWLRDLDDAMAAAPATPVERPFQI